MSLPAQLRRNGLDTRAINSLLVPIGCDVVNDVQVEIELNTTNDRFVAHGKLDSSALPGNGTDGRGYGCGRGARGDVIAWKKLDCDAAQRSKWCKRGGPASCGSIASACACVGMSCSGSWFARGARREPVADLSVGGRVVWPGSLVTTRSRCGCWKWDCRPRHEIVLVGTAHSVIHWSSKFAVTT